jgi:protein SCO1/2
MSTHLPSQITAHPGEHPPVQRWPRVSGWWVWYGLAALLVAGAVAFKVFQPIRVLPRIRLAPGFALTDQSGARLTSEDLRGRFVLYAFAHSRCGSACERQWQTLREVQAQLPAMDLAGVPLLIVVISPDAAHDQPEALQAFAASLGSETAAWRFASTSNATRLKSIVGEGFGVYYAEQGEAIELDPAFVLVDGWGVIRGEYRYRTEAPEADRLTRHLSMLADEVRNSHGLARYAYEAAHYFLCYAP